MNDREAQIRTQFASLRHHCDLQGQEIISSLLELCIAGERVVRAAEEVVDLDPNRHSLIADLWDMRDNTVPR